MTKVEERPVGTCPACLAWGHLFTSGYCAACYMGVRTLPQGICAGCRRETHLRRGYCRLCWDHARVLAHETGSRKITAKHRIGEVRYPQLFLSNMANPHQSSGSTRSRDAAVRRAAKAAALAHTPDEAFPVPPAPLDGQLCLFKLGAAGAVSYADRQHQPVIGSQALTAALRTLDRISESHGWNRSSTWRVSRALTAVLAGYADGDQLTYSRLRVVCRAGETRYSIERTAGILEELGVYVDERRRGLDVLLQTKLSELSAGIAAETEQWIRDLITGGPRRAPRTEATAQTYLHNVQPALLAWSQHYEHLRQVTRDDVVANISTLKGTARQRRLIGLRSLFGWAKKNGLVFRDPTSRIRVGSTITGVLQPLATEHIQQTVAAAVRPADPLIIALAAIHAVRGHHIREALLADVDVGNRQIIVGGRARPLEELTRRILLTWLNYRRGTWPDTPNPHLLINHRTAVNTASVGHTWLTDGFRGLRATLDRLRVDRHLDEALAHRADPLHLAVVFGIDERTALRYADSARQLLAAAIDGDTLR